MNRTGIADLIVARLEEDRARIETQFRESEAGIGFFYVDDLLPPDLAREMYRCFPQPDSMKLKKTLREYKYIAAQMNEYNPILEEAIYAFQDSRVVEIVREVCRMQSAYPDDHLYAGGISMMGKGQYLNPHLDNSHDKDRDRWRVLNLLYYVTEDWDVTKGGNLEVWPDGIKAAPVTIHSRFNRLAVMATHGASWHSVSPIEADAFRCCISNYYFSDEPLRESDDFHVTYFRGRPEQTLVDKLLVADGTARMMLRKIFKKGIRENPHVYKKRG